MAISVDSLPDVARLKYDEARQHVRSGDMLLCSGNKLFSQLIKAATKSVWSHVAFILYAEPIDRFIVLESVEDIGVRAVTLRSYAEDYNGSGKRYDGDLLIARHSDFESKCLPQLSKFAVDLLGHEYNKRSIAKIAARVGLSGLGFKFPRDNLKSNGAFICSEYAQHCYESVGIDIPYDERGFITPADFAKDEKIESVTLIS